MAKPKYCKAVAEFMEMELERLTGRLVMVPRLTKEEVEGIVYGWRTLTDEFEEECGCPRVKEVGDLVEEAMSLYTKRKIGKAVLKGGEAMTELGEKLKECGLG
jgi:hypothetical protein